MVTELVYVYLIKRFPMLYQPTGLLSVEDLEHKSRDALSLQLVYQRRPTNGI